MKGDLAVFHNRPASSHDSKAQPQTEATIEDQGQKLQDADAAMGRPLFLVQKRAAPQTSDLLHHVAGGKKPPPGVAAGGNAKPAIKPDIVVSPEGKIQLPTPPKSTPEVGIPEPLPPKPPDQSIEATCKVLQAQCNKKCDEVPVKPNKKALVMLPIKGLCYAGCAAIYGLCRLSGMISKGAD
ncbi:MAG: hypothetical protein ACR2RF_24690 [Geminicoccaceae bacterium]